MSRLEADMMTLATAKKTAEEAAQKAEGELAAAFEKYQAEWNERKRIYNQVYRNNTLSRILKDLGYLDRCDRSSRMSLAL